jgi:hypothetical protein
MKREEEGNSSAGRLLPSLIALLRKEELGCGKVALLLYHDIAVDGESRPAYPVQVSGPGMLLHALAICLDGRFNLGRRLSQCSLPECGRLFLTTTH